MKDEVKAFKPMKHLLHPSSFILHPCLSVSGEGDDFFGGVLHTASYGEVEARFPDDALALFDVSAFETNDDGHAHAQVSCRANHTVGDHITAHDAAEDIDQDGAHVLVREQYSEGRFDALLRCAAADIEKVRGLAPGQLDDVHSRHREPRAVDHAGDVAVELDVVEVVLGSLYLKRLFLVEVAQVHKLFMAIERVVVKVDLRIERDEALVLRQQERIDLHQRSVHLLVGSVERLHEFRRLAHQVRRKTELEGELARLKRAKADRRVNRLLENLLGRMGRDLFYVHAARRRCHEDGSARRAVKHDAQVEFLVNGQPFFDEEHAHFPAFGAGLVRDELHAEHLSRYLARFVRALRQLHPAAFAAPARMNLRFDDDDIRA